MIKISIFTATSIFMFLFGVKNESESFNLKNDYTLFDRNSDSISKLLLGNWQRTYLRVEDSDEIIKIDSIKNNYILSFKNNDVLIEKSGTSNDTLNWTLILDPLRIEFTIDENKMNLNFSSTLFIEELNDSSLHIYSKSPKYPEVQENDFIKYHMKFQRIED